MNSTNNHTTNNSLNFTNHVLLLGLELFSFDHDHTQKRFSLQFLHYIGNIINKSVNPLLAMIIEKNNQTSFLFIQRSITVKMSFLFIQRSITVKTPFLFIQRSITVKMSFLFIQRSITVKTSFLFIQRST